MKYLLLLAILAMTPLAKAIPVVNENDADSGVMTIYPDNIDPHHYYIAPNVVMIAQNDQGVPLLSYNEIHSGSSGRLGLLEMTLVPFYTRDELTAAEAGILKKDPQAEFSGLPFISSELQLTGFLHQLVQQQNCTHDSGLIDQEIACSMVLTEKGRQFFLQAVSSHTLFMTLQFDYHVQAVARKADNSYTDLNINHGMAGRIDGDELAKYPQLIHRLNQK